MYFIHTLNDVWVDATAIWKDNSNYVICHLLSLNISKWVHTYVHYTRHMSEIEHLYCSIVNVMLNAGSNTIPLSKPHRTNHIPNWPTKIEPFKEMTLFWQNEYCERGRPDSGF